MTYNSNAPNGLVPINSVNGVTWSGQLNQYEIAATGLSIFTGDLVTLSTGGTVIRASATQSALGVVQSVYYEPSVNPSGTVSWPFWPGTGNVTLKTGTTPKAFVVDDPNAMFTIQETNATATAGTPLTQGAVGLNANILYTAGNTTTGISAVSLDNSTAATTTTLNLKIVGLDPAVNNSLGSFANWVVQINNHIYKAGSSRPA